MGLGDVTLMGMIGAFLGWRAVILTFFISPFFGLGHAGWKLFKFLKKWIAGGQLSGSDRELAFGPYLSMAAVAVLLSWRWLWPNFASSLFETFGALLLWSLGLR
jgi:leader peptidase (prepilin peptidase)/N-methyltransferase